MYTSKATLAKWGKVKRVNRAAGGQSQITGYFSKLNRQGTKRPGSAGVSGDEQPGSDSAGSATTAAQPAAATADQPARRQREISLARHECSQALPAAPRKHGRRRRCQRSTERAIATTAFSPPRPRSSPCAPRQPPAAARRPTQQRPLLVASLQPHQAVACLQARDDRPAGSSNDHDGRIDGSRAAARSGPTHPPSLHRIRRHLSMTKPAPRPQQRVLYRQRRP